MSRFTSERREEVDRCILDADLGRLTQQETIELVHIKTGLTISPSHVAKRRYYLKRDRKRMWDMYRKDSYAYKLLHSELMAEADMVRARINKQIQHLDNELSQNPNNKSNLYAMHRCFNTLLEWNKRKHELVSEVKAIDVIGHSVYPNDEMESSFSQLESETNREMGTQSEAVF